MHVNEQDRTRLVELRGALQAIYADLHAIALRAAIPPVETRNLLFVETRNLLFEARDNCEETIEALGEALENISEASKSK